MVRAIVVHGAVMSTALLLMSGCPTCEPSSTPRQPTIVNVTASARAPAGTTRELVLHVEGLTCEGCAWQIREALQNVDGVADVSAAVADKRVVVAYDPDRASAPTVVRALEQVGYKSEQIGVSRSAATSSASSATDFCVPSE